MAFEIETVEEQLAHMGLRKAGPEERGWFALVRCDDGKVKRVWATDK